MNGHACRVRIDTPVGSFTVEVDLDAAPLTSAHFLQFVQQEHLDRSAIYRIVTAANCDREPKIEVIQFGWYPRAGDDQPPLPPVPHEPTSRTGLRHRDGAISLARNGPGTGTSVFFLCLGDQPQLDEGGARAADGLGFAVFGRVVDGHDTLAALAKMASATEFVSTPIKVSGQVVEADEEART